LAGPLAVTLFVVGILTSIMIHEWGHYRTAKWFGMRADRFFLGFGPTLWSKRYGETEFGVKALPLGGFVRIKGMSPEDERLRPLADTVFDPERIGAGRQAQAAATGKDVMDVPALPATAWVDLADELDRRGTPVAVRERITRALRSSLAADATADEAHVALRSAILAEVRDTGQVGDLHHRLTRGDEGRFFHDRPAHQRAVVLAAGSFLHFVQAAVLLFLLLWQIGPLTVLAEVDTVVDGSPAAAAGLLPGDEIVAIDGSTVDGFDDVRETILASPGVRLVFAVVRDGQQFDVAATPAVAVDDDGAVVLDAAGNQQGRLGFAAVERTVPMPINEAFVGTLVGENSIPSMMGATVAMVGKVFGPEGIGQIFSQVTGETERDLSGPVSLVGAGQVAAQGAGDFGVLAWVAMLLVSVNVFIGVFNILPLPPLDGGHLAVLAVEKVTNMVRVRRGRDPDFVVDPRAVAAVAVPVIVLVATVSLGLLWLDIANPVTLR